jgi:hypothetical protein
MLVISIVDHASELKYHPQKPGHILSIKPSGFVAGKYQTLGSARLDVNPIVCKAMAAQFDSKPNKALTIMISLPENLVKNQYLHSCITFLGTGILTGIGLGFKIGELHGRLSK